MGLIRKSLHVATLGAVSPTSKKQRVASQTLAAIQGGTPAQVRRAGGRYQHSIGAALEDGKAARQGAVNQFTPTRLTHDYRDYGHQAFIDDLDARLLSAEQVARDAPHSQP
jgi:hypothetical protein